MHQNYYHIAETNLTFRTETQLELVDRMRPFAGTWEGEGNQIQFSYESTDCLELPEGHMVFQGPEFEVYQKGEQEWRVYKALDGRSYAVSEYDIQRREGHVWYDRREANLINHGAACLRFGMFEQMMLSVGRLMLHSTCVKTDMGGILFSGVSGIGKTTQAELWMRHRNAEMINGDRTLLYKKKGSWFAAGSPYAGSSRCYVNASVPLTCIVFLQQGEENQLRRLNPSECFSHIYRHVVANRWNKVYMEMLLAQVMEMAGEVRCYLYRCTPDEEAVRYLENRIREENRDET